MGKSFLLRDVSQAECPWLERDIAKGETVHRYKGYNRGTLGDRGAAVSFGLNHHSFQLPLDAVSDPVEYLYLDPVYIRCAEETLRVMAIECPGDYFGITSYMLAPRVFAHGRKMTNTDPIFQPTLRWLQRHGYVECRNRSTWHLTEKGRNYAASWLAEREAS